MANQERRRRTRIPVSKAIRHSKYQVLGTPVFEDNSAVDLSSGGISFQTSQDYKVGTLVLLEFEVAGESLKILVCIAWIKETKLESGKHLVGAELVAIDPEHKKAMQSHLAKLIRANEKLSKPRKKKTGKKKTGKKKAKAYTKTYRSPKK